MLTPGATGNHIGFRLIRTVEDVDGQGNYLGDQFFLIRCRVEPSQREQSIADVDMMSRVLRRGDRRHRASYEGSNGSYYFSSIPLLHPSARQQGSTVKQFPAGSASHYASRRVRAPTRRAHNQPGPSGGSRVGPATTSSHHSGGED